MRPAEGAQAESQELVRARAHGLSSYSKCLLRHDHCQGVGSMLVDKKDAVAAFTEIVV